MQRVATLLQQRHIPGEGGRVAGNIHDPTGREPGQSFDGIGVQTLPGRIYHHHIGFDPLLFQLQGGLACVTAEKLRVFDAVALCVVPGILHRLGYHLHADDLARGGCHGQGNGADAAVKIQHRIVLGDAGLLDGAAVQPLGLVMIHLVKRPGRQAEI